MKNNIKIITIFGIVTSFFSVYSMESFNSYLVEAGQLKKINPLLDMGNLSIVSDSYNNKQPISKDHPLYADKTLALNLAAVALVERENFKACEEISETIRDAIRGGMSLIPEYVAQENSNDNCLRIFFSRRPTSVFRSIDSLFVHPFFFPGNNIMKDSRKELWIEAIVQGNSERQEIRDGLIDWVGDRFDINVPEDLIFLIFQYSDSSNIEENTELIKEAKKKFDEEHRRFIEREVKKICNIRSDNIGSEFYLILSCQREQRLQSSLDKTSNYFKKIIKNSIGYASENPKKVGLVLVSISTLLYLLINLRH